MILCSINHDKELVPSVEIIKNCILIKDKLYELFKYHLNFPIIYILFYLIILSILLN